MIRWLGQRDNFRCGPIAFVNILKWAGIKTWESQPITEKTMKTIISKELKCTKKGTTGNILDEEIMRINKLRLKNVWEGGLTTCKKHLKKGGIILLNHDSFFPQPDGTRKKVGHFSLIIQVNHRENMYKLVNNCEPCRQIGSRTVAWIHKKDLAKILRRKDTCLGLISKRK